MSPTKEDNETSKSETIIEESGVFKRTYYRKGRKRRVRTERIKRNPEKVVLGKIGELDIYCFPYNFPDKVFLGKWPDFSMVLSKVDLPRFLSMYNKIRWFVNGEWQNEPKNSKEAKSLRQRILRAYNYGLSRQKKVKNHEKKTQL